MDARAGFPNLTSIAAPLIEDRRKAPSQPRWLAWEAHSGARARARLTLADGRTRTWKAASLERFVAVLNDPKLAKALLLRRGFALGFVEMAAQMFAGSATGMARLSFNLGALSRNELLFHLLQAEIALRSGPLAHRFAIEIRHEPGVHFSLEVERPLPWLSGVLLRWRLHRTLRRLKLGTLRSASA
jgi:hypothetical protein